MSGRIYRGSCHCGAVRFVFRDEAITAGVRCNCSLCVRKGAVMSTRYYAPDAFDALVGKEALVHYQFGDRTVNHYFCRTCGISPFHDPVERPGHYRVNLGCVADVDVFALAVTTIDGATF